METKLLRYKKEIGGKISNKPNKVRNIEIFGRPDSIFNTSDNQSKNNSPRMSIGTTNMHNSPKRIKNESVLTKIQMSPKRTQFDRGDASLKMKPSRQKEPISQPKNTAQTKPIERNTRKGVFRFFDHPKDYNSERRFDRPVIFNNKGKEKPRNKILSTTENEQSEPTVHERSKNILTAALRTLNDFGPVKDNTLINRKKIIQDKYTFRFNEIPKWKNKEKASNVEALTKKIVNITFDDPKPTDTITNSVDVHTSSEAIDVEKERKPKHKIQKRITNSPVARTRVPLIKTIKSPNKTKTYKAVTFVDHKKKSATLQIDMPNELFKKPRRRKHDDMISTSGSRNRSTRTTSSSFREKDRFRKKLQVSRSPSPVSFLETPPPTEVAKWVPSCLTHQTKPYYEAWVDTTLSSRSKMKNFRGEDLARCIHRSIQEKSSAELIYEHINDETYMGRITVNKR